MCLAYLSNICIGALGYQKWVSDSLELELQTVVSHPAYILNSKPESSGITKKKCSCLLSHLSTHSLYAWVDGNIIYNSQRSKKKPQNTKDSFTGKWKNKIWHTNAAEYYTASRGEAMCARSKVSSETGWSLGATVGMKLEYVVLSETHPALTHYRIPLYEIAAKV